MLDTPILSLQNVSMYYHNNGTVVPGIVDMTMDFHIGEFVVITGESGGGKSTLLNVISSLAPYHDGEMLINGTPTSAYNNDDWEEYRREHISFIFQDYNLIYSYTVYENVLCAIIMRGVEKNAARKTALEYIDKVGLTNYVHRKASRLSSGQKQRLAIARALAQNTDIIVADEPTGNLDSENGAQIVRLLSELSKDKLVIMVSHNVDEACAYATRRIRIHNSHIASDTLLTPDTSSVPADKRTYSKTSPAPTEKKTERLLALSLAKLNILAQPRKTLLLLLVMLLTAAGSFIFAGGFLAALDDTPTKIYDNTAFRNGDMTRIVLTRKDGNPASPEDLTVLRSLSHVEQVELYDKLADINYFCVYDSDYYYKYTTVEVTSGAEVLASAVQTSTILLNENKFMKSATCLTQEDLKAGTLPVAANEVVYGSDPEKIGTTMTFIFSDRPVWGVAQFYTAEMTITGVLNTSHGQAYFSENLARGFLANDGRYSRTIHYSKINNRGTATPTTFRPIIMPNSTINGEDVLLSAAAIDLTEKYGAEGCLYSQVYSETTQTEIISTDVVIADVSNSSNLVITISQELFDKHFSNTDSFQLCLYIEDYAYTDDVIRAANNAGYVCVSPFRMGSLTYDQSKVNEQLITLLICAGAFIAILLLEILLLNAFLKFKQNDYYVLSSIGLRRSVIHHMVLYELIISAAAAIFITAISVILLWTLRQPELYNIMKYMRWYHYLALVLLNLLTAVLLAKKYAKGLEKNIEMRISHE